MAKESTYSTFTPVLTDYLRAVDNPGGSPATGNVTITALLTLLKASTDGYYFGGKDIDYTTSDFTKTSDTTLANVPGMTATLTAGGVYRFMAVLFLSAGASGGCKAAMSGTCTATRIVAQVDMMTSSASGRGVVTALDTSYGATAAQIYGEVNGLIVVNTAGTLTLQFAQQTSNGTASKVLAGSWFEVNKIA